MYVAWRLGVPLVGSVQGAMTTAGQRWLYARCARLLVSSREQREGLVRAGFLSRSIDVCSPGVDAEAFSPVRQSDRLRDRWHVSSRRLAVACVASATDDRTIRLAEVFRDRLYARGVEHAMVFVTEGVPAAGVRHRLGDAVFTGPLSEETLAVTLASADVALFPVATAAANSLALMAQASGLPAIVAGGGPALEQVIEGVTASACRANAPDEWAQAVAILARTPPLLQAMRRHAREHAARKTWPLALDPVFRAYRRASSGLAVLVPCLLPLDEQRPDVNPLPEV